MNLIKNIAALFTGKNSLLDTKVEKIVMSTDEKGELQINLTFTNFRHESDFNRIQILFQDIEAFSFYYKKNYTFYNVENYKLLKIDGKIYLSLDPDETIPIRSIDDADFIFSKKAILIENNL